MNRRKALSRMGAVAAGAAAVVVIGGIAYYAGTQTAAPPTTVVSTVAPQTTTVVSTVAPQTTAAPITLDFWKPPHADTTTVEAPVFKAFFGDFTKQTNINVRHTIPPWVDYQAKLSASIAAGSAPDIAYMPTGWLYEFGQQGALESLDTQGQEVAADFFENLWNGAKYGGHQLGIPFVATDFTWFYNMDLFDKAGITKVPDTWDEWLDAAKKTTDTTKKVYGYGYPLDDEITEWGLAPWYYQAGADFVVQGTDGKWAPGFNNDAGVTALNWIKDLYKKYNVVYPGFFRSDAIEDMFLAGKVAMIRDWAGIVQRAKTEQPNLRVGSFKELIGPGKGPRYERGGYSGIGSWVIFLQSKNKDAAWQLVKYLSQKQVHDTYLPQAGLFSPRKDASQFGAGDPAIQPSIDQVPFGRELADTPGAVQIWEIIGKTDDDVVVGGTDPKQALQKAADAVTVVLKAKGLA